MRLSILIEEGEKLKEVWVMKESIKKSVKKIVGKGNVIDDEEELQKFSSDYSGIPSITPEMVVKVNEDDEVLKVVLQCNDEGVPIYPSSSKVHYYGGTIPRREGAIVMDLSGMNRIHEIDELSHWVHIGPGVTWGQLQADLEKKDIEVLFLSYPIQTGAWLLTGLKGKRPRPANLSAMRRLRPCG